MTPAGAAGTPTVACKVTPAEWLRGFALGEQPRHLDVVELMEVLVALSDALQLFGLEDRHDLVRFDGQRAQRLGRGHRRGEHHAGGAEAAHRPYRGERGSAGGNPVVNDDHGSAGERRERPPGTIARQTPLNLRQLAVRDPLQLRAAQSKQTAQAIVEVQRTVLDDRAHAELRLHGRAELAHDQHFKRRPQRLRHLGGDRHAAPRQRQHDRVLETDLPQSGGELTTRFGTVGKAHGEPPSRCKARIAPVLASHSHAAQVDEEDLMTAIVCAPATDAPAFAATVAGVAALLARQGFVVLVAASAVRRSDREQARALAPRFLEVHVATPLDGGPGAESHGLFFESGATPGPESARGYEPPVAPDLIARGGRDALTIDRLVERIEHEARA
jgi:adenylylsulfate kinase